MRILVAICLFGFILSECDDLNALQCSSNTDCEWIEDIESGHCSNFNNSNQCNNYSQYGCYWYDHWYYSGWDSCSGGSWYIDNSYCQENPNPPTCSEMSQTQCNNNSDCQWTEDIEWGNCGDYNSGWSCDNAHEDCFWDLCYGGWYGSWSHCCRGGSFQTDNSYCEEIEMPECNEEYEFQCTDGSCIPINRLCNNINDCEDESDEIDCESCSDFSTESNCNYLEECEWVEEIDSISCYSLSEINCGQVQGCNWGCSDWGDWYTWICYGTYMCLGGIVESDNSYCEEVALEQGDLNGDFLINILDVIEIINIILNNEWNYLADMNGDHEVNVLDIVAIVDIILGN